MDKINIQSSSIHCVCLLCLIAAVIVDCVTLIVSCILDK